MARVNIETYKQVIPMIYAYTTPGVPYHDGWTKIGYTDKQTVEARIKQQTHTANIKYNLEWKKSAVYDDGSGEPFTDHEFHAYLENTKYVDRRPDTEWFKIDGKTSKEYLDEFKMRDSVVGKEHLEYKLRNEQQEAVKQTYNSFKYNDGKKFLWNAKPRFGKTLTTYDLIQQLKCKNVLIVTNRPSIANSWLEDFNKFIAWKDEYAFVSETNSLVGKQGVISYHQYLEKNPKYGEEGQHKGMIVFESMQGLKGSTYLGGKFEKLKWLAETQFDLLVIDESQEGIDTTLAKQVFKRLKTDKTLYLSGTPFKQLAKGEFGDSEIYNWSYADEQEAKENWDEDGTNPYENLPKLNMLTYELSNMIYDKLYDGAKITDEAYTSNYAFDLNEFFITKDNGKFKHEDEVIKFLKSLYSQERYPFSTQVLRDELKHTLWYFNRVDSCKAMARLLKTDDVFKDYEVVLAAGDGKLDDNDALEKSFDRVKKAIRENDKTITLTVGQLTVGVTIPEWSAVLMLCNLKSSPTYMQAVFRAQNPCRLQINGKFYQKQNAYVFDFDPARTLIVYDEFASNLSKETVGGKGTTADREKNIKRLLNFFPVLGEDSEGRMVELDPKQVLSIPRKLKSQEVVRHGFMDNYLFANISNIFHSPKAVQDIVNKMQQAQEDKSKKKEESTIPKDMPVNEDGEVEISNEVVIGKAQNVFGEKVYEEITSDVFETAEKTFEEHEPDKINEGISLIKDALKSQLKETIINPANNEYNAKPSVTKKIEAEAYNAIEQTFKETQMDYQTTVNIAKAEHEEQMEAAKTEVEKIQVENDYKNKMQEALNTYNEAVKENITKLVEDTAKRTIEIHETAKVEEQKKSIEDDVRSHLRGFSRTIPSFIMAYGDENMTLQNLDDYTDDDVFLEVTGIEESSFRFLRDGGYYREDSFGNITYLNDNEVSSYSDAQYFEGQLFDEIVFNDSIKEFLRKKKELNNYFDESLKEDIFDYIPPQKTNQIYTPKKIVKQMVDMLEEENPGCYDDPDKTFIDLYMKSGLYITEIVKKLYNSEKIKQAYPDDWERLKHIFAKQVYGLAPTKIIYLIAKNFILGFADNGNTIQHNLKLCDTLPYAKDGTLNEKLDELFGGDQDGKS